MAVVNVAGRSAVLPLRLAEKFAVYTPQELTLGVGERIRITKSGQSVDRSKRLDNGSLHTVVGFITGGCIRLDSGAVLAADFAHLSHGYAVTSHAGQGKTVDVVLVAESALSFRAASREQFYVSVSRGRERVTVFTDEKAGLSRAVARTDPRPTATELMTAGVSDVPQWRAWVSRRVRTVRRLAAAVVEPIHGRTVNRDDSWRVRP